MKFVVPHHFIVAETVVDVGELSRYLREIGANKFVEDRLISNWGGMSTSASLTEVMGRLCYKSWEPGLNPNITRVRQNQKDYIENLEKVKHWSVFEHASISVIFSSVSRVFTHELVRHRVGTAFSQESMRYVRLEDIPIWFSEDVAIFLGPLGMADEMLQDISEVLQLMEAKQAKWANLLNLNDPGLEFAPKKKATSALRRYFSPTGVATEIGFTANVHEWKYIFGQRTSEEAEEEMQIVMGALQKDFHTRYPLLF